ncbi:MAG: PA14 domain-containing protein [Myxococcota bacterium]
MPTESTRMSWRRSPGTWMAGALLLVTVGYLVAASPPSPRWHAEYRVGGSVIAADELVLDHRHPMRPPGDEDVEGPFAAEWETCLEMPTAGTVAFLLTSSGRARLYVDGAMVIDDWDSHSLGSQGTKHALEAGRHLVRVAYEAPPTRAAITLAASFGREPPTDLPAERLSLPGDAPNTRCAPGP